MQQGVVLTHIHVPLSNPHINMYFCYCLNGLFILSLCTEGAAFSYPLQGTPKTCAQKPWQYQKPLRASAAMMQGFLSKLERESPQGADPEETPQGECRTGIPSPTTASGFGSQGQLLLQ